jgi:glycosyltransferase involved in cell wall biosynthesis
VTQRTYIISVSWNDRPISRHFKALARALIAQGHRVVLLVASGNVDDTEFLSANPIVLRWPSVRPTHARDALFLYKLIRKYRPECLIANFSATNVMLVVGYIARVGRRVTWYHTLTAQNRYDAVLPYLKGLFFVARKAFVYWLATDIVCNSQAALGDIHRIFKVSKRKCRVFHNSLEDPLTQNWNSVQRQPNRLVCVGRLHASKGQDVLIKSAALLKESFPDVRIELVGSGPCKGSYIDLVETLGLRENCVFVHSLPHQDILKTMATAALTIVPSRQEAFGLVIIESLAVGTPVVASDVGGIPEIIRDGVEGLLVPPGNEVRLAEKISELLRKPELRAVMSSRCRERFQVNFEERRAIEQQVEWLASVPRQPRPPDAISTRDAPSAVL